MTWTQRWIARAQRKADERDARYQRREAGKRAGQIPPSLMDGLVAYRQTKADRRIVSDATWFSLVKQLTAVCGNPNWIVRGPDGIEVSVGLDHGPRHSQVAWAWTQSGPSLTLVRQFPDEPEALSYLIHLVRRIRAEGVEVLCQETGTPDTSET